VRILIADDEPSATGRLELALACIPEAEIVGVAHNGHDAAALIRELKPDIALLDIQMPRQNGFGVVSSLKSHDRIPEVIFVTAYNEYAIRAFEVHAVDYLLKPVPFERLREAIGRASERLSAKAAEERFAQLQDLISTLSETQVRTSAHEHELWVKERERLTRIFAADIDFLEAAGDYVVAHLGESTHLLSDSMSSLEQRLNPQLLMRVHRSAIVNLSRVRSLRRRTCRGFSVILLSGREIAVGPSYVDAVLSAINAKRWAQGRSRLST
jgi:DNA-binding LytR/AlgR family response regulator